MRLHTTRSPAPYLAIATLTAFATTPATAQSPITWTVKNIVDAKTDISTRGALCIAVNCGPEVCEKVVNGVHFQADRSHWTRKIMVRNGPVVRGVMHFPDFTSGGFTLKLPYNRTAPASNTNGGPRHASDPDYDFILRDVRHSPTNNTPPATYTIQCSIAGLVPGNTYEIQLWYGNSKQTTWVTEWDNGVGGRQGKGGIFLRAAGQVATGTFVASASGIQTFTNFQHPADPNATPPLLETRNALSAVQVRDITNKPLTPRATYYGEGTPGTDRQAQLGGTRCSPAINLTGHPKINTSLKLTAENSTDAANSAMVVAGMQPLSLPFLAGTLLVAPVVTVPVPMPQPASPYVHDHELQLSLNVPAAPIPVYVQVLQLDSNAPGGVAMSPAMKIEIGL